MRHDRQSLLGPHSEETVAKARIAIVGLGGGGSHIAQQLAHVGIGTFFLFDPDIIDGTNLNRLVGGTANCVQDNTKKVHIAERLIKAINPDACVEVVDRDWRKEYLLLREAAVIIGSLDSFRARVELETAARRYLTPYIDLGMDVFEDNNEFTIAGQVALSLPGRPCLQCMGIIRDDDLAREEYGAAGGRPQVIWPNGILASAAVGMTIHLLTPWFTRRPGAMLLRFDGNAQTLTPDPWTEQYREGLCPHHKDVGDPFFNAREVNNRGNQSTGS